MNKWRIAVALTLLLAVGTVEARTKAKCGLERWAVKVGTDSAAQTIDLTNPVDTTIAYLRDFTPPPDLKHFVGRVAGVEDQVWTVEATLTMFKTEADMDYHLVLTDDAGLTIIAEIPNPRCVAKSSPFYAAIVQTRAAFVSHFGSVKKANPEVKVRITGVGFFDFIHGQTGVAPNGIELHSVTALEFLP